MQTDILGTAEETVVETAATLLRTGQLVALPTETVYGLGANGLDPEAVAKIFITKGRPQDNPLILHIENFQAKWELPQMILSSGVPRNC